MALKLEIQTYQILTNDDEVCIPSLSSILLVLHNTIQTTFYTESILKGLQQIVLIRKTWFDENFKK